MFKVKVKTDGFKNYANFLKDAIKDMSPRLSQLNAKITVDFKDKLEERTPVRTGFMKAHWFIEGVNKVQLDLRDLAEYSSFVDLGTVKMEPRHVTKRAIFAMEVEGTGKYEKEVGSWLKF